MKFSLAPKHPQHSKKETGRASLRAVIGLALTGVLILLTSALSAPPDWWTTQGVLNATQDQNNYSAVTVGQLKNMAHKAKKEMDIKLPNGAGPVIDAMVQDWIDHKAEQNQYTAATVGQLKKVAKPFYDRLIEVGARPPIPAYPWPSDTPIEQNYALANAGQVKNIFSFAILDQSTDADRDGLLDEWETQNGLDPGNPWDGFSSLLFGALPPSLGSSEPPSYSFSINGTPLDIGVPVNKSVLDPNAVDSPDGEGNPKFEYNVKTTYIDYYNSWTQEPTETGWTEGKSFSLMASEPTPGSSGGYEWRYVEGHYEPCWVEGYYLGAEEYDPVTDTWIFNEFHEWIEAHLDPYCHWVDGYWEQYWVEGYPGQPGQRQEAQVRVSYEGGAPKAKEFHYEVSGSQSYSFNLSFSMGQSEAVSSPINIESGSAQVSYQPDHSGSVDPPPSFAITASDGAGPKYRKIGLNGAPLSDSKPQAQDESGENPEETYIDAYTGNLRHSVSDVYDTVDSSTLPLVVRRDVSPIAWNTRSGLRPVEQPELAFGAGWSTNLCANIKMVQTDQSLKAYVTDEQGATQMFVWDPSLPTENKWAPDREEKQDVRTRFNTLELYRDYWTQEPLVFIYKKKYGATCYYTVCPSLLQSIAGNRETGAGSHTINYYARMDFVVDRQGNQLSYEYPMNYTLIPKRIVDYARPGREIRIQQNDGRITGVRGPDGQVISYSYGPADEFHDTPVLTEVSKGGATVTYDYFVAEEEDPTPDPAADPAPPFNTHIAVNKITDELDRVYQFELAFEHGITYTQSNDGVAMTRTQLGMPPRVTKITLPDNSETTFTGQRNIFVPNLTDWTASAQMLVSGPGGNTTYTFSQPKFFIPLLVNPGDEGDLSQNITLTFSKLQIHTPVGSEAYEFDENAAFAVSKATDLSGNITRFVYADGFDDPVVQINALNQQRTFAYDAESRIMTSMTDERGVHTEYELDLQTKVRLNEKVYAPNGSLIKRSDFIYGGNPKTGGSSFAGFMSEKTDYDATGPGIPTVTTYTPDMHGRVCEQSVALGANKAITTTTTYDPAGRKRATVDANGNTTLFSYDVRGRLIRVTHPGGSFKQLAYDAHGNLVEEIAENGMQTTHAYDELNRRISSQMNVPALGGAPAIVLTTSTTYNGMNLPVTETDVRGRVTTHTYDAIGRRTKTVVGSGTANELQTTFTYGANSGGSTFDVSGFKPTSVKDARGFTSSVVYDDLYRPVTQTSAVLGTTTTVYDAVGNPVSVTDALNRTTQTQYDWLNHPTVVTLPGGLGTRLASYAPSGLVLQTTDEMGRVSNTTYDTAGRAIETLGPVIGGVRPTSRKSYDANGNVIAVQDPLGRVTEMQYDNRNRPTKVIAPAVMDGLNGLRVRPETTTVYDVMGNPTQITDALGQITRKYYDGLNRVVKVQDALNQVVTSTYDEAGNVLTVTDALGHVTTNTYDIHNRLTQTLDAAGQTTAFEYDKGGNRTSIKDGLNHESTFTYDGLNRVLTEAPGGNTYTYNKLQKLTRKDSGNKTITYAYDARDRVTSETWTGGSRQYAYNLLGQLLTVTDTTANANVAYAYDVLGRQTQETSNGVTHTYGYDLAGNRISTVYGGTNRSVVNYYDAGNRLIGTKDGMRVTRWFYDRGGRMVGQWQANGQYVANSYDVVGRLKTRRNYSTIAQTGLVAEFSWHHDAGGNVTRQHEFWPAVPERMQSGREKTTVMTYDDVYRLLTETVTGTGQSTEQTIYAYDAGNNRSSRQRIIGGAVTEQSSYTYNALNQLTSWVTLDGAGSPLKSATLTYDASGNRSAESVTEGAVVSAKSYMWNAHNLLVQVIMPNYNTSWYTYDYRARRNTERVTANPMPQSGTLSYRRMVYSGGVSVQEYGLNSALTVEFQRGDGMGGGVGGMLYSLRGGQAKFSLSNGRGDVVAQSDSQGAVTWTASYEAFGKRTKETGANLDRQRANTKEEDPTGLLNEGFRYRDLETGVWLSRDPAGFVDGPNLYAYVLQNPWTAFDPDGLELREVNRITRKKDDGWDDKPKRGDPNTKSKAKYESEMSIYQTARDNHKWNEDNRTLITAWENYDHAIEMMGKAPEGKKVLDWLRSSESPICEVKMGVEHRGLKLRQGEQGRGQYAENENGRIVNVALFDPNTASGSVRKIDGTLNPDSEPFAVTWHELYHVAEPSKFAPDPHGIGTGSPHDDAMQSKVLNHERRATRFENIIRARNGGQRVITQYGVPGRMTTVPDPLGTGAYAKDHNN